MKFKKGYKVREIAGEHVVIMHGRAGSDATRVIALNETALWLWEQLEGRSFTVGEVAGLLVENYGIDAERAAGDAEAWISKLRESGLTEE